MSGYILLGLAAVFLVIVKLGHIRDLHDAELRETDPETYCKYGATLGETWRWWRRRNRSAGIP